MKVSSKTRLYAILLGTVVPALAFGDTTFGPYPEDGTIQSLATPSFLDEGSVVQGGTRGQGLLAVKWQHRINEENIFTLSAGYGDDVYLEETPYDSVSTMAALSWTSRWTPRMRITGSLFVGDEDTRDDVFQHLTRKYFGFSLGGRLNLLPRHSSYVSFKLLRSDFENDLVEGDPLAPSKEHARVTAGWDWQVSANWRLRAGADYTLDDLSLNFDRYDRSRVFFNTRFDFR